MSKTIHASTRGWKEFDDMCIRFYTIIIIIIYYAQSSIKHTTNTVK